MAGEATKPEIEKFLLAKLESGIKKAPYKNKFKKMKKLLESQLESATDDEDKGKIREKLYLLNNLTNENSSKFDYFSLSLVRSLNQIKKGIQSDAISSAGDPRPAAAAAAAERSTRTMAKNKPLGLEADELAVRNLLLYQSGRRCEDFNAVGIVGAEGVGKTTLARPIFASKEVEERFLPRIWISMAEDPVDKDESLEIAIAKRILLALGISDQIIHQIRQSAAQKAAVNNQTAQSSTSAPPVRKASSIKRLTSKITKFSASSMQDQDQTPLEKERERKAKEKAVEDSKRAAILAALIHAIRLELMGKRYLIVLDDASSSTDPWYKGGLSLDERLGFAFPKGSGGAVLVIGWPDNVVRDMVGGDGSAIHRLLPLEEPELCWKICKDETEGDGDRTGISDEKQVRDEVVKRSSGLPVAAMLMGKIIKQKNQQTSAGNNTV